MTALPLYPQRPRTRGECADVPRPCPFVSCRHHLYLDIDRLGRLVLNTDKEPDEMGRSCSLDVADAGGDLTRQEAGDILGVTSQAIEHIERDAMVVLRAAHGVEAIDRHVEPSKVHEGARFGRWTLVSRTPGLRRGRWLAACDCGTQRDVRVARLVAGQIVSCGCKKAEAIAAARTRRTRKQTRPDASLREDIVAAIAKADGLRMSEVAKAVGTDVDRARPLVLAMAAAGQLETETLPIRGCPVVFRIRKAEAAE